MTHTGWNEEKYNSAREWMAEIGLSTRLKNALLSMHIYDIADLIKLMKLPDAKQIIMREPNIGKKTAHELLYEIGPKLKTHSEFIWLAEEIAGERIKLARILDQLEKISERLNDMTPRALSMLYRGAVVDLMQCEVTFPKDEVPDDQLDAHVRALKLLREKILKTCMQYESVPSMLSKDVLASGRDHDQPR